MFHQHSGKFLQFLHQQLLEFGSKLQPHLPVIFIIGLVAHAQEPFNIRASHTHAAAAAAKAL